MEPLGAVAAFSVTAVIPFQGYEDRLSATLASEWESSSFETLSSCMRKTASLMSYEGVLPSTVEGLFFRVHGGVAEGIGDVVARLSGKKGSVTSMGEDLTKVLFDWLSDISAGDVEIACAAMNSMSDLLVFVADAMDAHDSPLEMLMRMSDCRTK